MGTLAGLLKSRGHDVTGSDGTLYPPMSTALADWGIPVFRGFAADHVTVRAPDLVVIGNVVRADNEEARAAIDSEIPYRSFSDALYELAIEGKHSVVVSGTHGKTTVTSAIAALLTEAGRDPSALVGGFVHDLEGGFRDGAGPHFIVEGDEYDTAFFDKTPKFLHYGARTLVLTSVEFDHADIYRDLDHVKEAFRQLVAGLPSTGHLIAFGDDPNVVAVIAQARCPVVRYGFAEDSEFQAEVLEIDKGGTRFLLRRNRASLGEAQVRLFGRHNVANATAALATAIVLGVPFEEAARALGRFRGVRRRQEVRGIVGGVTLIDDFAHHPTAVRETLTALRARYPDQRLWAVFEPRTNTSRRRVFQSAYAEAFDSADRAVIAIVPDTPIYSATGVVEERFSATELTKSLEARGVSACAMADVGGIADRLVGEVADGDVVVVMSNGGFGGLCEKLLEGFARKTSEGAK